MALVGRPGRESTSTRDRILNAVEQLMIDEGHAAVTYRAVAARAGVGPSNVQYYFPNLDDLLVATVTRRTQQSLGHLVDLLAARPNEPLRVLWDFGSDETTAALAFEFSALGLHHESVRAVTVQYMRALRDIQLGALSRAHHPEGGSIPPVAALFLLTGIPKLIQMEQDFDIEVGHREVAELVRNFLDEQEPR